MINLFKLFIQKRQKLNPLEILVLQKVATALREPAPDILTQQIAMINKVQRIDNGREVDLYRIENGKSVFPEAALFPNKKDELELARLRIRDSNTGHGAIVSVHLVKGRIFSIEFSCPPGDFSETEALEISIECVTDPLAEG